MMISGRDIRQRFPGVTEEDLLEWCGSGRVRCFQKWKDPLGADPKSPRGWRRVYASAKACAKYDVLCERCACLRRCLQARREPDEEVIKADREQTALRLAKSGRPVELPEMEQFQYNLFRRRQRETAEISRLLLEITEIEKELKSPASWQDPSLPASEVIALVLESFFRSEDIEKILAASGGAAGGEIC